jgi:LmbE family N-acetylglucosaminyl deacetylase
MEGMESQPQRRGEVEVARRSGCARMIRLQLPTEPTAKLNILCLGSHSDDIEIGCGGTILRLAEQYPNCIFHWVVFTASGERETEARRASELFAGSRLGEATFKNFRDGFLPFLGAEVKNVFEALKLQISPSLIFTHYGQDAHQDHRLVSELTWNTFRNHLIMEYEIPKYDGDMGKPSVFVPLGAGIAKKKISHLMEAFTSQHTKPWFQEDTFCALMRLRGMECNSPSGYAEAFYCRKLVL